MTDIADPAERAIAERGRDIVMRTGCIGCHATNGPQGPDLTRYLAGGGLMKFETRTRHVRQPQPDARPGNRARPGAPTTRSSACYAAACSRTAMSCRTRHAVGELSNWTEEDRHAVVVYLRHLPAIRHQIPEPVPGNAVTVPGAFDEGTRGRDYGVGAG